MSNNYLDTIYNEERTPKTNYPYQLAKYLSRRFSLKQDGKLLEPGPGRGDFLLAFKKLGFECQGIDREIHPALAKEVELSKVNIEKEKFPFPDNTFDIVYHKSLIEHFYSPHHLMSETRRILKPGGKVIILTPDWVSTMKVFYEDITHCRPNDTTALKDTLTMYGFKNIEVERFYQLPLIWKYPILKVFTWLLRLFLSSLSARKLAEFTGIKSFRWSVELMVLGVGEK